MTVYYTESDDAYLRRKAEKEGRPDDGLALCSDGIYRTSEERYEFERAVPKK